MPALSFVSSKVVSVLVSFPATAITICGKTDNDSNNLTINGIPATGNICFGISFVVMGKRRLPCDEAKTTAHVLECVKKNGGVIAVADSVCRLYHLVHFK